MRKIGSLKNIEICFDDKAKINPYRVYEYYRDLERREDGKLYYGKQHRRQVIRYADLYSCTYWMSQYFLHHNEERS